MRIIDITLNLNWRWNSMFLKAINELEINNKDYVLSIAKENLGKLLVDNMELNKDNSIGNLIMSISLNRLLVNKFSRLTFRNNQKEIERYLEDSSFYTLTDKKVKNLDSCNYLDIKKNTISINTKYEKRDIVMEDEFSISRLNYFIDHINDVLIDEIDLDKYDFYKSQYIYLTFLYFDMVGYDKISKKEIDLLDDYLDKMREGIEDDYFDAFIYNAKNRYYNLNPYGILCPIKEVLKIEQYIDELNAHNFDKEVEEVSKEVIKDLRRFIVELKKDDIPEEKRRDLLSDSDFLSLSAFFDDMREGKIDDVQIVKDKKLWNIKEDVCNLIDEIRRKRD